MKSKKIFVLAAVLVYLTCLSLPDVNATMLRRLSEKELAKQAQTILIGTCTFIKSEWNEERTKIFTYIKISPKIYLKGYGNSEEITIKQPGGIVGDIGMHVDKVPDFEEGDEILVFLQKGTDDYHKVLGLYQGKFTIQSDERTGRKILVKKRHRFVRHKNRGIRKKAFVLKPKRKIYLDEFAYRINKNLRNDQ